MRAIATCLSVTVLGALLWLISLPVLITPSQAQPTTTSKPRGAPGPVLGGGVSILVIAGGAYWVATRLRRKSG
jgi:hypothetical protein